jgi:hypothetical protein
MDLKATKTEYYRGKYVLIIFKKSVDHPSLEGTLFTIDPKSGTVVLSTVDATTNEENLQIVLKEAIESIEGKWYKSLKLLII